MTNLGGRIAINGTADLINCLFLDFAIMDMCK